MNDASAIGLTAINEELGEGEAGAYTAPAPLMTALPDYVKHSDDATRTGMLSAHAIVLEFESAAAEIEKLGTELKAAQVRAEEAQAMLANALKDLTATAKTYRDEAARVFAHVEHVTTKASEASALCAQLRERVVAI